MMEPGCPNTMVALRAIAPGVGHLGPQLAGEDTEALRTRVQPKVAAGGWLGGATPRSARCQSQDSLPAVWGGRLALQGGRAPKTVRKGVAQPFPVRGGALPCALSLAGQAPSVLPLLHPAPSW